MKGIRCDICGLKDGHQGMTMIHCDKCKLAVHKECNGMNSYALKKFTCWACKAVGQSFEIEDRDEDGCRRRILQKDRPVKCALCNYSGGTHAMHPLYDRAGPGGRQIYTDGGLAWAHTLCAFVLTNRSFIFGCDRYGNYGQDDDDNFNDDRSENSELIDDTQESAEEYPNNTAPIHHFVYDLLNSSKDHQRVHSEKKALKCSVCAADDTPENVLRICVQCNANDEHEFKEFRKKHRNLGNDETCTDALHVGCARWGGMNPDGVQRVYFFPGNEDRDPVVNMFCSLHAKDVDRNYQKKLKLLEERRQIAQQQENVARPPNVIAIPPPMPENNRHNLERTIFEDLIRTVAPIQDFGKRNEVFKKRKQHWKMRLDVYAPEQFKEVWKIAKEKLGEYILNGNRIPNQGAKSREGSMQRVVSRSHEEHLNRVLEAQRQVAQVIANKNQTLQTQNGPPKRINSTNGVALKSAAQQAGSKRKKYGREIADDSGDDEEFEWEQNDDDESDLQQSNRGRKSKKKKFGRSSLVSNLCHPLPRSCTCCRDELLEPQEYCRPPPRTNPIDGFGEWDL